MQYLQFEQTGIVGYPLFLLSCLAMGIILERSFYFLRTRSISQKLLNQLLETSTKTVNEEMKKLLEKNLFGCFHLLQWSIPTMESEEEQRFYGMHLSDLEKRLSRFLSLLKIIAAIAPLLGLLGTILGMMEAFQAISTSQGAVTPALIASGISKALLTTAIGLAIAIPSLLSFHLFQLHVKRLMEKVIGQMESIHFHRKHGGDWQ